MVHISQMVMKTLMAIKKCNVGDQIIIKTFKKDRQITIQKEEEGCKVIEDGFEENVFEDILLEQLPKLLKELKEREFPRSNQIWFSVQKVRK